RQPSLSSLREIFCVAPAEAREASEGWWSQAGSNRRPLACHASALPAELWPLQPDPIVLTGSYSSERLGRRADSSAPEHHSSGFISSLFVVADVADDVGDVLIAFLFVGDEGRIIIVVAFDGLVDLDVVLGLGNGGLDLAGVLLGVGFLKRHEVLVLR